MSSNIANEVARRFQVCWQMLGFQDRMRMLPRVVKEVVFVESDSTLTLRLDIDALHAILPDNNDDSGRNREAVLALRC